MGVVKMRRRHLHPLMSSAALRETAPLRMWSHAEKKGVEVELLRSVGESVEVGLFAITFQDLLLSM